MALLARVGYRRRFFPVQGAAADAQLGVHQHVRPQLLPVEGRREVAEKDHRIFQSLGFVNAENLNRIRRPTGLLRL